MMLKLFTELRKLSAAVAVSHGGYLRATYDTRKFKEMAHAAVRNFLPQNRTWLERQISD